jgi:hypothetical protein
MGDDAVKARLVAWQESRAPCFGARPGAARAGPPPGSVGAVVARRADGPSARAAPAPGSVGAVAARRADGPSARAVAGAAPRADKENAAANRARAGATPMPARREPAPVPAPVPTRTPLPGKTPQSRARGAAGATDVLARGDGQDPGGANSGASGAKGSAASTARRATTAASSFSPAGQSGGASLLSRAASTELASAARSASRSAARSPVSAVPAQPQPQREAQDKASESAYATPIVDTDLAWRWRLARAQVLTDPARAAREAQVLAAFGAVEALRDQVAAQREALLRARARRMAAETAHAMRAGALRDPEWLRVLLEDLAAALGRARELLPVDGAGAAPGQDLTAVLAAALATIPLATQARAKDGRGHV